MMRIYIDNPTRVRLIPQLVIAASVDGGYSSHCLDLSAETPATLRALADEAEKAWAEWQAQKSGRPA